MRGLKADEARAQTLLESLGKTLDVYDKILASQKYIAGDVSFPRPIPLVSESDEYECLIGGDYRGYLPSSLWLSVSFPGSSFS